MSLTFPNLATIISHDSARRGLSLLRKQLQLSRSSAILHLTQLVCAILQLLHFRHRERTSLTLDISSDATLE